MARDKGTFRVSSNYEPQITAPFDARALVECKADLTSTTTWVQSDGSIWIYNGMIVSVNSDIEKSNNGVYFLNDKNHYTEETSWTKLSDSSDIQAVLTELEDLQAQIDDIEGGGSADIELDTEAELPEIGENGVTYFIQENQTIQRWDAETSSYVSYGGTGALDIKMIYGGNANG